MKAQLSITQIAHALRQTAGNISQAARSLGVERSTIYRRIDRSQTLQTILTDSREELADIAESMLRSKVLDGDIVAIIFTLKTQGKKRGYVERHEFAGTRGQPIEIVWDDTDKD